MTRDEVGTMKNRKRDKLEKAGWKVGTAGDFLGLTPAEESFIGLKLGLACALRNRRTAQKLTQAEAARKLGSSQSRLAKMEAADPSVSVDLLVRALLALGATPGLLARAIAGATTVSETSAPYRCRGPKTPAKKKANPSGQDG